MLLYGVMWREPGYGQDLWVMERKLFDSRNRALEFAYNIANNHWHLSSFSPEDYRYNDSGISLFRDGKTLADYDVVNFEY